MLWVTEVEQERDPAEIEVTSAAVWMVRNKIDLDVADRRGRPERKNSAGQGADTFFAVSADRGDGISELVTALAAFARDCLGSGEDGLIGRERQRRLLQESADGLRRALTVGGRGDELVAEELRAASHSLGRLLGRIDVEDVLDKIFREFCIGK